MIVITGGAGMIGSIIAWHLNQQGRDDLVIADQLQQPEQWQNLCHRDIADYLDKEELFPWLDSHDERRKGIDAIIHMGAISNTAERDFNRLLQDNLRYSQHLWMWCARHGIPLLYASSAATYGAGEHGYDDRQQSLRPLNSYGYSKYLFDRWVLRQVSAGAATPPQWCGLKFFNVYGPNEYHKQRMASVVFHTFNQVRESGTMRLFRSERAGVADGMQSRDFIYVKDAAKVVVYFLENPQISGIFNVGSGDARTFNDLAENVMVSMGKEKSVTWVDMPDDLKGKYQYFTQASMHKLRAAGYTQPFTSLEDGIRDYVQNYLMQADPYC